MIFGFKFDCKSGCRTKVNPSGFSNEKPPPFAQGRLCCGFLGLLFVTEIRCEQPTKRHSLHKDGKIADFLICLSVAEIWCKQVVYVQTAGLHRRSMNAPTDLFYKYICLWPEFDINNSQSKALFGKESCQRSWLRDWEHFGYIWYSVVSSLINQVILPRSIPPVFLRKPPPFTKVRLCRWFLGLLFVDEIWCKQIVYVQTCGLHRRSMNAPTI